MGERVIPEILWQAVQDPSAEVGRDSAVMFGLDVHPDRTSAAIVACDGKTCEMIEHRAGTSWVLERAKSLCEKWDGTFVIDNGAAAVSLGDDLEAEYIPLVRLGFPEVAAACGRMYDSIADCKVTFRTSEPFDIAVSGLAKRPVSDRFVWARQASSTDITPFVAATLALAKTAEPVVEFGFRAF
jgi:hypothetical protein